MQHGDGARYRAQTRTHPPGEVPGSNPGAPMFIRVFATALAFFAPHHQGCAKYVAGATFANATWSVVPTRCGRRRAWLEPRRAFAEVPATEDRETLYLQFRCHAIFAAYKPDWDLEAFRPVVSFSRLIATGCNP